MRDFRFVHAADLHLDTPFQGIALTAPEIARAMRDASLEAWDALVDWTLEERAAFLLLAGDIYDGEERGVRAQLRFRAGLERLSEAGVATLIVHGNHDPLGGWSAIRSWPERVTVFGSDAVGSVTLRDGNQTLATIHGISYAQRDVTDNLALRFERGNEPGLHIGLLHCHVGGSADHAPYSPCTLEELEGTQLDYWALGHIHTRRSWKAGRSWVVYPGNLQGRSPKASERQPKGAVCVEVKDGTVGDIRFRALDRIRFHHEELDISDCDDVFALKGLLLDRAHAARELHAGRGVILVTTLGGRSVLHADLARATTLAETLQELRDEFAGDDPFLWWDHIRLRSRAPLNFEAIRDRDDFLGALLRESDRLVADPDALDPFIERHERPLFSQRLPAEVLHALEEGDAHGQLRGDAPADTRDADEPSMPGDEAAVQDDTDAAPRDADATLGDTSDAGDTRDAGDTHDAGDTRDAGDTHDAGDTRDAGDAHATQHERDQTPVTSKTGRRAARRLRRRSQAEAVQPSLFQSPAPESTHAGGSSAAPLVPARCDDIDENTAADDAHREKRGVAHNTPEAALLRRAAERALDALTGALEP